MINFTLTIGFAPETLKVLQNITNVFIAMTAQQSKNNNKDIKKDNNENTEIRKKEIDEELIKEIEKETVKEYKEDTQEEGEKQQKEIKAEGKNSLQIEDTINDKSEPKPMPNEEEQQNFMTPEELRAFAASIDRKILKEIMNQKGYHKLTDIPEEKRNDFIMALKEAV